MCPLACPVRQAVAHLLGEFSGCENGIAEIYRDFDTWDSLDQRAETERKLVRACDDGQRVEVEADDVVEKFGCKLLRTD